MTSLAEAWLRLAATRVDAASERLTRLDAAIGDGDHGINLARGFSAVVQALDAAAADGRPAQVLSSADALGMAGRVVLGTVGGASGALYGRALARAAAAVDEAAASSAGGALGPPGASTLAGALDAAVAAIAALGRSQAGQKTMLDALVPAAMAFRAAADAGTGVAEATAAAAAAAEEGAESTLPMLALRGRASYLGDRSRGHLDPGAVSAALLLRALADAAAG